jgi:hypothetical protein
VILAQCCYSDSDERLERALWRGHSWEAAGRVCARALARKRGFRAHALQALHWPAVQRGQEFTSEYFPHNARCGGGWVQCVGCTYHDSQAPTPKERESARESKQKSVSARTMRVRAHLGECLNPGRRRRAAPKPFKKAINTLATH